MHHRDTTHTENRSYDLPSELHRHARWASVANANPTWNSNASRPQQRLKRFRHMREVRRGPVGAGCQQIRIVERGG